VVKRKVIKRGSISHVEKEKERLGNRFDPSNEPSLEMLPDSMGIDTIPINTGIRSPRSVILLPPVIETQPIPESTVVVLPQPLSRQSTSNTEDVFSYREIPPIPIDTIQSNLGGGVNIPPDNQPEDSVYNKKTFKQKVHDIGHRPVEKLQNVYNKTIGKGIEKGIGTAEKVFGATNDEYDNDEMAIRGGYSTSKNELERRRQESYQKRLEIENKIADVDRKLVEYANKIRAYESMRSRLQELDYKQQILQNKGRNLDSVEQSELEYIRGLALERESLRDYEEHKHQYNELLREKLSYQRDYNRRETEYNVIVKELEEHQKAYIRGKDAYRKEHGIRREWLAPFAQNVESMIGAPSIGDISQTVGYGDLTSKSFSTSMKDIVGRVKVSDTANDWVRTKAGDRGLVEALVKVNQNNMITPFGAPGTIQNSRLGDQFSYKLPIRQIGVGEVTARPGYRLTPEDIHRKKSNKSKPSVERKQHVTKSKPQSSVKKGSIKGSLSMNMSSPIIATIGDTKSNSIKLTMDNIKPFTTKNIEINMNKITNPINKRKTLKVKL
jgi:hypothetical protein